MSEWGVLGFWFGGGGGVVWFGNAGLVCENGVVVMVVL